MAQPSTLWTTRCPVPTTSGIAQHFRFLHDEFARHGIDLASIRASGDPAVRESHFDHSQPNMFREGGNAPPIWARANGRDTVVVGITWVDEEQLILVRGDSPIRTLADLKGSRFGVPRQRPGTRVDVARAQDLRGLLTALRLAGLQREDVVFVDVETVAGELREPGAQGGQRLIDVAEALLAGQVDVIFAKGSVSAALVADHGLRAIANFNVVDDPTARVNAGTPRPITVDRQLALAHPEIVARYLAVLLRTAEWAATHPDDVVEAVAIETSSTPATVRQAYGPQLHRRLEPKLTPEYVAALAAQKDFFLAEGFIAADFDVASWILTGPLALARTLASSIELGAAVEETAVAA